jgi:hypothetical protein
MCLYLYILINMIAGGSATHSSGRIRTGPPWDQRSGLGNSTIPCQESSVANCLLHNLRLSPAESLRTMLSRCIDGLLSSVISPWSSRHSKYLSPIYSKPHAVAQPPSYHHDMEAQSHEPSSCPVRKGTRGPRAVACAHSTTAQLKLVYALMNAPPREAAGECQYVTWVQRTRTGKTHESVAGRDKAFFG